MKEENNWLIDLILAFFHSAEWKQPIISFIDENCIVFDSEDENKLEYTQIHGEFKKKAEKLIEAMLAELSASNEDFAKAFAEAPQTEGIKGIEQVLEAIDDFSKFKLMMVSRN